MFTIKEYNQQLNKSYNASESYIRWTDYRNRLFQTYGKYLDDISAFMIAGAGFCNDINLKEVAGRVNEVTLLDIDMESMKTGIMNQKVKEDKIVMMEEDLTGLDNDHFFEKVIHMLQADDLNGIRRYFSDETILLDDLKLKSRYDGIMISSIYTQLLLTQYSFLLGQLIKEDEFTDYLEPFMFFISKVIQKVNSALLRHIKENGIIICFSDILEYDNNDIQLMMLGDNIDNPEIISSFVQDYTDKYGHGLGSFGILDMEEQMNLIDYSWHLWPFDENRTMLVKMVIGTKKEMQ